MGLVCAQHTFVRKYKTEYFVFRKTFYRIRWTSIFKIIFRIIVIDKCSYFFVLVFFIIFDLCLTWLRIKVILHLFLITIIIKCMKSHCSTSRRNSFASRMACFKRKISFLFLVCGAVDTMVIIIICIYANLQPMRRHKLRNSYLALALITIIIVITTRGGMTVFFSKWPSSVITMIVFR